MQKLLIEIRGVTALLEKGDKIMSATDWSGVYLESLSIYLAIVESIFFCLLGG